MQKFAMLTHFTGLVSKENSIYYRFFPILLRIIPKSILKRLLPLFPPHKIFDVKNITSINGKTTEGCAIMCPLLPEQFIRYPEDFVIGKLVRACELAKSLGAQIVGLAAFTSVVGNEGQDVSRKVSIGVTSGNTYTAFLAIDSIRKASLLLGFDNKKVNLVVLGATGDIGSICVKVLSKSFKHITLVARNKDKLYSLMKEMETENIVHVERNPEKAVAEADVVICVTSSVLPLFDVKILKPGSIFCDVSVPAAIPKMPNNFRPDVLIYDGGKASLPNPDKIKGRKWLKLFPNNIIFGCLAETILLSLEGRSESFSLGRGNITEGKIEEVAYMALRNGFITAPFSFGDYMYGQSDFDFIKKVRKLRLNEGYNLPLKGL